MANALTKIQTNALADDAVTLAKQAAGTDGQVITYDASGNPTAVGPGTDGQVLTSTGAGSPPAFEAIPAAGITDVVSDTTPQLGGNLDVNTKNIILGDSAGATDDRITFGAGTDLSIYHDASHSYLSNSTGRLRLQGDDVRIEKSDGSEFMAKFTADGAAELYYDDTKTLETISGGAKVTGNLQVTGNWAEAPPGTIIGIGATSSSNQQSFNDASSFTEVSNFTLSYTPKLATSTLRIYAILMLTVRAGNTSYYGNMEVRIKHDSEYNETMSVYTGTMISGAAGSSTAHTFPYTFVQNVSAADTNARDIKIELHNASHDGTNANGHFQINEYSGRSHIHVFEIAA